MAESNLISWTPANWITILLMGGLGFLIFGALTKAVQNRKAALPAAA